MPAVLLSIKAKYANLIISGKKTVEWRKTLPNRKDWDNMVMLYSTKPDGRISGIAKVSRILTVDCYNSKRPSEIKSLSRASTDYTSGTQEPGNSMEELIADGCVPEDDLKKYSRGERLYAWIIDWAIPVTGDDFSHMVGQHGPQSWQYIELNESKQKLRDFLKMSGKINED